MLFVEYESSTMCNAPSLVVIVLGSYLQWRAQCLCTGADDSPLLVVRLPVVKVLRLPVRIISWIKCPPVRVELIGEYLYCQQVEPPHGSRTRSQTSPVSMLVKVHALSGVSASMRPKLPIDGTWPVALLISSVFKLHRLTHLMPPRL